LAARRNQITGIALVNLATLSWATNMALGRWLRDDVGPLTLAAGRYLVASFWLLILLRRCPPAERRIGGDWRLLALMSLCGVVAFTPMLYLGLRYTTTANATMINGLGPLITGLLAAPLIGEPMSRRQVGGAIVALLGVIVLISGGSLALLRQANLNWGDLLMLVSVALWSLYSIFTRQAVRHRSTLSATAFASFLGLPFLVLGAVLELHWMPVRFTPQLILILIYIGTVPALVGLLAWNDGVRRLGASGAMVFYNTLPLYGAIVGTLFLAEPVGWTHLVAGTLIIGGGLWASRGHTQERP
jgi:drug/metabolite transporter (DMT)-like permease